MHERQFHTNVRITYPIDRTGPVVVECYVGEFMQVNLNDPNILRYADKNGTFNIVFKVINRNTGVVVKEEKQSISTKV